MSVTYVSIVTFFICIKRETNKSKQEKFLSKMISQSVVVVG